MAARFTGSLADFGKYLKDLELTALVGLGRLSRTAGDSVQMEEYYRRAVDLGRKMELSPRQMVDLFGGLAKGRPLPLSDVDIAIFLKNGVNIADSKLEILGELMDILQTDEIDLVVDHKNTFEYIEIKASFTFKPEYLKTFTKFKLDIEQTFIIYQGESRNYAGTSILNFQEYLEKL